MPSIDITEVAMSIRGFSADDAGAWAARALKAGAVEASISPGQGVDVFARFPSGSHGAGTLNLAALLLFACEAEGVGVDVVLENAKKRGQIF